MTHRYTSISMLLLSRHRVSIVEQLSTGSGRGLSILDKGLACCTRLHTLRHAARVNATCVSACQATTTAKILIIVTGLRVCRRLQFLSFRTKCAWMELHLVAWLVHYTDSQLLLLVD